jgi:site-specific DNA recombinase
VSSALLRGRKDAAGSVRRIAATEIETTVLAALKNGKGARFESHGAAIETLERIIISRDQLLIRMVASDSNDTAPEIKIARSAVAPGTATIREGNSDSKDPLNESLIQSIARSHAWIRDLQNGTYDSIEALAKVSDLHPKVVRQALRLAFLSPSVSSAVLDGGKSPTLSLTRIPNKLPLGWKEQQRLLD